MNGQSDVRKKKQRNMVITGTGGTDHASVYEGVFKVLVPLEELVPQTPGVGDIFEGNDVDRVVGEV